MMFFILQLKLTYIFRYGEEISRTISFVGPTGSGKSSIVRCITPPDCKKPQVAGACQLTPTTANIQIYDTVFDDNSPTVRILGEITIGFGHSV